MSEMHLRQPGFTYSTCEPFTKTERTKRLKKHGDFKDLPRTTENDKVLRDKVFNNAKKPI